MRPTFLIDLEYRLVSAIVPKTQPHAFTIGDVLWMIIPYRTDYGAIPADTKLFVSHVAEEDGTMWLLAEGNIPALFQWDNQIVAAPYDCEDLLPCLRAQARTHTEPITISPRKAITKLALVTCFAALGWMSVVHALSSGENFHQTAKIITSQGTSQTAKG